MNDKIDIIFCSIPYTDLDHIYSAPAILKGVVRSEGYTAKTVEFGLDLFNLCDRDRSTFDNIQLYFYTAKATLTDREFKILYTWKEHIKKFVKKNPSRFFGISILSYMQQSSAYEICEIIRDISPETKIVIGGRGAKVPMLSELYERFNITGSDKMIPAAELLKKRNKCDFVVIGDGESPILEILQEGTNPVIEFEDKESFNYPEPDYEDYLLDQYVWESGEIAFPITGSKGCVRDCDFCDVRFQFGKFKYRSGKDIANEMLSIQKKYGFNKFQFTDSLVNGGLKPFREFCTIIAEHNDRNPDHKIKWTGQYICRPELTMPQDLYSLMAKSGAEGLTIGAESGSDNVLEEMNKKTTVEALLHELEQFRQHNITCVLLMMTSHWGETWDNFVEHCETLIKLTPYMREGTISGIQLGWLASMLDGTPGHDRIANGRIIVGDILKETLWINNENPMSLKERIYRRLIVSMIGKKLNMPTLAESSILQHHYEKYRDHVEDIDKFYDPYRQNFDPVGPAEKVFYNFDEWYNSLISREKIKFEMKISAEGCNGGPMIRIFSEDKTYFDGELTSGEHNVEFEIESKDVDELKVFIEMSGKTREDTVIDEAGNIIKDKHIQIKKIMINNYNISSDYDFVNNYLGDISGLWQNGTLQINLKLPFDDWYNLVSVKNSNVAPEIRLRNNTFSVDQQFVRLLEVTESLK